MTKQWDSFDNVMAIPVQDEQEPKTCPKSIPTISDHEAAVNGPVPMPEMYFEHVADILNRAEDLLTAEVDSAEDWRAAAELAGQDQAAAAHWFVRDALHAALQNVQRRRRQNGWTWGGCEVGYAAAKRGDDYYATYDRAPEASSADMQRVFWLEGFRLGWVAGGGVFPGGTRPGA